MKKGIVIFQGIIVTILFIFLILTSDRHDVFYIINMCLLLINSITFGANFVMLLESEGL